ncbi:MAG: HAMP domain-containing protein [Acidobacteria bacterium]|nr:MAG: HAMP domain-containing protein [Acidobacteriota bacterium]REK11785.1 MAG: HAMP domain-containing protein [Acidobacteriota bacterium]
MKTLGRLRKALRDNQIVLLLLALALTVVTLAYYLILRGRGIDTGTVNNQILLFFLRNVNAVLITAIVFVLIRNLVKLWVERRRRRLGSKFRTKLVATYIGLSLIPVLLLFAIANQLVQGSLDTLFSSDVDSLLEPGYGVAQELTTTLEKDATDDARLVLDGLADLSLEDIEQLPELGRRLQEEMNRLQFDLVYVYQDTEFVQALLNPRSGLSSLPELTRPLLLDTLRDGRTARVLEVPGRDELLILAALAGDPDDGARRAIVVVGNVLGAEAASQSTVLVQAYQQQRQIEVLEPEIRAIYLLGFLTVTLVLLLICTWIGLYLARRVTGPIQDLAEGTRRIMGGDLDYRVADAADDELGVLVHSFNRMTSELQRNKLLLEARNEELRLSNETLDSERQWIDTVLQNVAAGVVSTDFEGTVLTCNPSAARMLGTSPRELIGEPLAASMRQSALANVFAELLSIRDAAHRQVRVIVGGEWKTFDVSSAPLAEDRGARRTGWVVVLEDLTELIRAQKLATWTEAARRIAHEIKNPLTPIKLSAERLLRRYREDDPSFADILQRGVEIIVREVGNMKAMVDEFSRFARMPRPQPSVIDLGALLGDTVRLYRDIKPGVEVEFEVDPPGECPAALDPEQFRGVLVNLLDNAVDATEPPGKVSVRAARHNGSVRIEVADNGCGIPVESREKLFLPYYSTKGRGSGLGLAIVHRIVTDHYGSIRVEANEPRGSIFTIDLPQG